MEQLYLIEFYINSICLKTPPGGAIPAEDKKLTVNIDFGKFASLLVNENEFANDILVDDVSDDEMEVYPSPPPAQAAFPSCQDQTVSAPTLPSKCCLVTNETKKQENPNESDNEDYTENTVTERAFNSGASLMFAHNPPALQQTLKLFPLELSVWTDDESEKRACVGITKISWASEFIEMIGNSPNKPAQSPEQQQQIPLTLPTREDLRSQISGSVIGQVCCMIRLTILGHKVITRFRQAEDGDGFIFRNRVAASSVKCKKYGINTSCVPDQITCSLQVDNLDTDGADICKIIAASKTACEPPYAAGNQMKGLGNRTMTIPCSNPACKLSELIQRAAGEDPKSKMKGDPPGASCPPIKHNDDCCCNCKYLNIPLEKDAIPIFSDKQKSVVCEVCGGVSYDGKTCKDKDKPECSGPCNLDKKEGREKNPNIQRMLFEGLTKMLANARTGNHKQFCPDFKHKSSCPIGGACCQ